MFTIPTSSQASILTFVTDQLADAGTLLLIALAVGIPLFFYVVKRIIGLIPKGK
jgi:hypothetical protein